MAVIQEKNSKRWTKDKRKWFYKCYYKDLLGNNKCKKSKLYLTKKEAEVEERKFLNQVSLNQPSNDITFDELFDSYLESKKDSIKITSYISIESRLKDIRTLKKIKLQDFNINHFNNWKREMNTKKYSTTYKNNIYKLLRSILNYAIKYYDLISLNQILNKMTNFTNPNELKKEMLFYTYDEFKQFIEQEDTLKFKTYFETLYYCGLRKGEANALTWNDINFENSTLNINKNVTMKIKGQKYVILPTKTKGSNRVLPMCKTLKNGLLELKNECNLYTNFSNDWFVFGGIFPLPDTSVQLHQQNNEIKSNTKHIRIHDFRHSCASLLINNGASITLVAKYLGHSNISTTLNTYSHMFKNQFEEIVKVIDNLD